MATIFSNNPYYLPFPEERRRAPFLEQASEHFIKNALCQFWQNLVGSGEVENIKSFKERLTEAGQNVIRKALYYVDS